MLTIKTVDDTLEQLSPKARKLFWIIVIIAIIITFILSIWL